MMINFRGSSAFEGGDLESKGKGKLSIHFNGSDETVEVILRTVISVNQLSVCGAVAELCVQLLGKFPNVRRVRRSPSRLITWKPW